MLRTRKPLICRISAANQTKEKPSRCSRPGAKSQMVIYCLLLGFHSWKLFSFLLWQQAWTFLSQLHHKYLTLKSPTFIIHSASRPVGTLWQSTCHVPLMWTHGHSGTFLFSPSTFILSNEKHSRGLKDRLFLTHKSWRKSKDFLPDQ